MGKQLLAFIGISLVFVPWLFTVMSVFGLANLPNDVQSNTIDDASARLSLLSNLYHYCLSGMLAMFGIMVLGFGIDGMQYRPKWMFWILVALGLIWLPFYGFGTMIGLALILYAVFAYRRFFPIEEVGYELT